MRNLARLLAACLVAALPALRAHAAPAGRILHYGLCDSGSTKENYAQPDATAGYASRGNVIIGPTTDRVPLHKGVGFGYYWQATGLAPDFDVKYLIRHPPITRKDGKRVEAFEETLRMQSVDGVFETADCYFLDEDYELVPGEWTITLVVQDLVQLTHTFHVTADKR
jgi:hypothetical protein